MTTLAVLMTIAVAVTALVLIEERIADRRHDAKHPPEEFGDAHSAEARDYNRRSGWGV